MSRGQNANPTGKGGPKKGEPSRNPSGLSKEQAKLINDAKLRLLRMLPEAANQYEDEMRAGTKNGFFAAKDVFDRALGKPKESIEHSGPGGDAIPVIITVIGKKD